MPVIRASLSRRAVLAGVASVPLALAAGPAQADEPTIVVTKDPTCGCCEGWAAHLREAGFAVKVVESADMNRIKARLGVPRALTSCHTAEVGPYVIEGHVPAGEIRRLLAERPRARGLAVPGKPLGSPGMEAEGMEPDAYEVVLFGPDGRRPFARYRGAERI